MTMFGLSWGLRQRELTPVAKLIAIRLGDNCDQDARGKTRFDELQDWCCATKEEIADALNLLAFREDLAWDDTGDGFFTYSLPYHARPARAAPPKPNTSKGSIYVITGRLGRKIGITSNLGKRVTGLRLATLDQTIALEWSADALMSVVRKAERLAHAALADKLIRNEWFDVSFEDAQAAVIRALNEASEGRPA